MSKISRDTFECAIDLFKTINECGERDKDIFVKCIICYQLKNINDSLLEIRNELLTM